MPVRTDRMGQPGWMMIDFLTEGEPNLPPPDMPLWHIYYFELITCETIITRRTLRSSSDP